VTIGNVPKSTIDARWYDVEVPGGHGAFWYNFANSKIGRLVESGQPYPAATGHNFGFEHKRTEFHGGFHRFNIQSGSGAAANLQATLQTPTQYWQQARTVVVTDHALLQPSEKFSVMPGFVAKWAKPGDPGIGYHRWFSMGVRPAWHFSKYFSVAFEPGFDYVKDARGQYEGWLRKFTIAPQIAPKREFFRGRCCGRFSRGRAGARG
jgi:maltoporin